MKKIITFILTAVIILLSTITVSAASTVMSAENKTAKFEEIVTVDVSITGNTGFKAYGAKVSCDDSALELQEFIAGDKSNGYFSGNKTNGAVSFATNKTVSGDGVLFTVKFKVKTNVGGKYPVTITLDKIGESSTDFMQVTVVNGSVTVVHIHNWDNWKVTKKPSCVEKGTETRTCSECKTNDERDIAKTNHTFGKWGLVKKATCEEHGQEKRVCDVCHAAETKKTDKLAHTYGEWSISKNSTETQAGLKERVCSCGHIDTQVIPAGTVIDGDDNNIDSDNNITDNGSGGDSDKSSTDTDSNRGTGTILWIVLGLVLLLILLLLLILFLKKRKKDEEEQQITEL